MITATSPTAAGVLDFTERRPCWLCGDLLHLAASAPADEYVYVDEAGSQTGTDADLRQLPGGGYARLAELDRMMTRAQAGKRCERTWLYWALAREYSMLKVRLEMGGTFHVHHARQHRHTVDHQEPRLRTWTAPECCGWPMWLRPSGWHCRQNCGTFQEA